MDYVNKHKLLFAFAYVVMPLLLAWIGYLVHNFDTMPRLESNSESISTSGTTLYNLPQISLSMAMASGKSGIHTGTMKLDLGLEVKKADASRVQDYEPRIVDRILFYMRKHNFEDLQQPGGERELREGLEREINRGAVPIHIASVVVQRMVFE